MDMQLLVQTNTLTGNDKLTDCAVNFFIASI